MKTALTIFEMGMGEAFELISGIAGIGAQVSIISFLALVCVLALYTNRLDCV